MQGARCRVQGKVSIHHVTCRFIARRALGFVENEVPHTIFYLVEVMGKRREEAQGAGHRAQGKKA